MTLIFPGLQLLIFVACLALLMREGLWSNAITLFNVVTAALLATNFWEPLASVIDPKYDASYTYWIDFLCFWGLFAVILLILRKATDSASRTKVSFKRPVERAGGIFFACWIGWMMVCLGTFSLHMAPLARNFLFGAFQQEPESTMFFGLAPDRRWLGFAHMMSSEKGSLGHGTQFDPNADFILRYGNRRASFEREAGNLIGGKK